jgi:probable phosphoglycerate mutase
MTSTPKKTIYFVRHGESLANTKGVFSATDTPLTEVGRSEAHSIQDRCDPLEIEVIISSDYKRALETAQVINETAKVNIVESSHFREINHPPEIVARSHDDREAMAVLDEIRDNQSDSEYHYSSEENMYDFRDRLADGLESLTARSEETILVVTHSFALATIAAILLTGADVDDKAVERFNNRLTVTNTGITVSPYLSDR